MSAFFAMGGYAAYVWPAYSVSLAGIAAAIALTLRAHARARKLLADLEGRTS
jgi:heme exporter protein D